MTHFIPVPVVAEVPATKTVYVRRAAQRGVSPLRIRRLRALLLIEELTSRQLKGTMKPLHDGMILGSAARAYPVSYAAIRLELQGVAAGPLADLAEAVELGLVEMDVPPLSRIEAWIVAGLF